MAPPPADPPPSRWRSYRDVDAGPDPAALGAYMERLAAVGAIAAEKERSLALLRLAPGRACLDVGCGTGPELGRLARLVAPGGRVVGLDRSAALLAEARRRMHERPEPAEAATELIAGDAQALPFADGEFDACRADRALQHLERPEAAVAEMVRVTRPGGRVVVTEFRWGLVAPDLDRAVTDSVLAALASGGDREQWIGHRLTELCESGGLIEVEAAGHSHTIEAAEEIAGLLDLEWSLRAAVAGGAVSAERAKRWRASLLDLAARGEAFAGIVVLHVAGVVPVRAPG